MVRCDILISLAQPSRNFERVRSLSLWRGANFDIAHATSRPFLHVRSLSLWRGANFDIARATSDPGNEILYEFCGRSSMTISQEFHGAALKVRNV